MKGGEIEAMEAVHSYSLFKGGFAFAISLIEVFGVAIRTVSLALRLVANLACRHILLTLFIGAVPGVCLIDVTSDLMELSLWLEMLSFKVLIGRAALVLTWPLDLEGLPTVAVIMIITASLRCLFSCLSAAVGLLAFILGVCRLLNCRRLAIVGVVGLCLRMLETLVCAVQAYVFYALSVNYSRS